MVVKSDSLDAKLQNLDTKIAALTQERDAFQTVANQAAFKLLNIENLVTPFLNRKFNWVTALFHLREFVEMVKQIIAMIKEFKDQYMKPPTPVNDTAQ
jgi:hypothetical protein